jgi:dihydroorotate dehydrogenase (fumarate)
MYQLTFVIQVAFSKDSVSSINSYGYSPHPLATYLEWIQTIIQNDPTSSKPFIISITSSSPNTLSSMISSIQSLRTTLRDAEGSHSRIAIELNTSCPNIADCPPPAYNFPSLAPLLSVLVEHYWKDPTLTLGLKLPPYVWSTQFEEVIRGISELPANHAASRDVTEGRNNPIAFLTCTNTLGSSLFFSGQAQHNHESTLSTCQFALPTAIGGLAGESIHALSLGNVHTFTRLLAGQPTLQDVKVIGVGGVTSPEALDRMRKAGASAVGCATLLGKEGVGAFKRLSAGRQD